MVLIKNCIRNLEIKDKIIQRHYTMLKNLLKHFSLMAVTKTVPADAVNYAIDECGINLLGENRVQEYLSKKELSILATSRKCTIL